MTKQIIILNGIILFYIIQRISELLISNENEKWLIREHEAREVDPRESLRMRIFHSLWFISLAVEANWKREFQSPWISAVLYFVLAVSMGIRFHTMEKLKQFWTVKVLAMKNQTIATSGLYRYFRHPNYAIVVAELICVPLLMKAYFTMITFSLINFYILSKRIELEETTLMNQTNYKDLFYGKKAMMTIFLLMGLSSAFGDEMNLAYKNYEEAKKGSSYIKFKSESTKLGLITTSFDGYVREVKVTYTTESNSLKTIEASLAANSIDTDLNARNEKLYKEILETDKFPAIMVSIPGPVQLTEGEQSATMIFTVKDKKISKNVKFTVAKKDLRYLITGHTTLGLKEMGLPDPSIAIAKVRDNFDFDFAFTF